MIEIKRLEVRYHDNLVGQLVLTKDNICVFEYSAKWLQDGFSISPFELPLKPGIQTAKIEPFGGGFGVFDDSLPDGWGQLILDRYLQKQGINPWSLNILQRLALVGASGRGALEYRPDYFVAGDIEYSNFDQLAIEAQKILENEKYGGEGIDEFQQRGGSPGGARPKIFVNDDDGEWLVKFRAKGDPKNIGKIEYEYSLLAKECGIEMPRTKLFDNKYFGTERFDKIKDAKIHVVSVAALLGADYRLPCIDYLHIFKVCSILTHSVSELWKVFRLMVFNLLISNKDDHAKNFSFIYDTNHWRLAPAYDLLPSGGINGYRTTSINDSITPDKNDCIEVAVKMGLSRKEANEVYEQIRSLVAASKLDRINH